MRGDWRFRNADYRGRARPRRSAVVLLGALWRASNSGRSGTYQLMLRHRFHRRSARRVARPGSRSYARALSRYAPLHKYPLAACLGRQRLLRPLRRMPRDRYCEVLCSPSRLPMIYLPNDPPVRAERGCVCVRCQTGQSFLAAVSVRLILWGKVLKKYCRFGRFSAEGLYLS